MNISLDLTSGLTKKICHQIAKVNRNSFVKNLPNLLKDTSRYLQNKSNPFEVISMTGGKDFPEQTLSILSFVIAAGAPEKWTIYSDGSVTKEQQNLLTSAFRFVNFENWNKYLKFPEYQGLIENYVSKSPAAKKVQVICNHPYSGQTIFCDSDIVYYSGLHKFFENKLLENGYWYLADTDFGTLDEEVKNSFEMYQLNFGFLILNDTFRFEPVFEYLAKVQKFHYFSDQTAFHLAFKSNGGKVLDPRRFYLSCKDQFDFGYSGDYANMCLRHYVHPVRHKMWQKNWEWHLKI